VVLDRKYRRVQNRHRDVVVWVDNRSHIFFFGGRKKGPSILSIHLSVHPKQFAWLRGRMVEGGCARWERDGGKQIHPSPTFY
jgi:hypothetical protein